MWIFGAMGVFNGVFGAPHRCPFCAKMLNFEATVTEDSAWLLEHTFNLSNVMQSKFLNKPRAFGALSNEKTFVS